MLELGKRIRVIRKSKNLSAVELSKLSGVARSLISQLESGKRQSTSIDTVYRLAKALDVPTSSLLAETSSVYSDHAKQSNYFAPHYLKEQDLAYLPAIEKARESGLTPVLLNELIEVVTRIKNEK